MEISQIALKVEKVEKILMNAQKAGEQVKSWAAIGQQSGIYVLNHDKYPRAKVHINPCKVM